MNATVVKAQTAYPHKLARNANESKKNLELLFALQRLAYPELNKGIRMKKNIVKRIPSK